MERRPHRAVKKPKPAPAPEQPDIEAKVREAEIANIGKKLKAGKTLNAREAALISEYSAARKDGRQPDDLRAMNLKHGATILGCPLGEVKKIRDAGCPGFPHGRPNIPVIRKWMQDNPGAWGGSNEDNLKERKMIAQCQILEHDYKVASGEFIANDEVVRIATAWASQVRAELVLLIGESPTWAGLDAPTLQDRAKNFVNGALGRLTTFSAPCTPAS